MHYIKGKVIRGRSAGRKLGFPTANIRLHRDISHGIYISKTVFENKTFPSVTFVGNASTFGAVDVFVETFILDFDRDIYNRWISVWLLKKIRDNQKYDSISDLVSQMNEDVKKAKEYFKDV